MEFFMYSQYKLHDQDTISHLEEALLILRDKFGFMDLSLSGRQKLKNTHTKLI
jgi:hypothetical protein